MSLEKHIEDIQLSLRSGRYANEQAIKQGVVLRMLAGLGWPVHDTQCVFPEFPLERTRVDYALCQPPGKPRVVIEVKQPDAEVGGDLQLFQYAFHAGAQIAVLTTGRDWSFYLPSAPGSYEERRFLRLDLFERSTKEAGEILLRFVGFEAVRSGEAVKNAQIEHAASARKSATENAVPVAWRRLLNEPDSLLVDLVTEEVEKISGYSPDRDFVATFISKQNATAPPPNHSRLPPPGKTREPQPMPPPRNDQLEPRCFQLDGKIVKSRNANELVLALLRLLHKADATFLDRFATRAVTRKRHFIARKREDLYPQRPDLMENSKEIISGWWLGTNYSNREKVRYIDIAKEVAGARNLVYRLD